MTYGVRQYGVREYGDGMRVITEPIGGGPPAVDEIAGTDTFTFGGSGTLNLLVGLVGSSVTPLTFSGSGVVVGTISMGTAPVESNAQNKISFRGSARLSLEVPVVAPPTTLVNVKRISPTMPTPSLDARGRPQ